jgi:hypothetical protein
MDRMQIVEDAARNQKMERHVQRRRRRPLRAGPMLGGVLRLTTRLAETWR